MTRHKTRALLLIDVINPMTFAGGVALLKRALPAARRLARVKAALRSRGVPTIYVNDNFGCWDLEFRQLVERFSRVGKGREIVQQLGPERGDYFILKPQHSGFYRTSLDVLLERLGTRTLILTGFAANICVWFTANDAHMRGYRLIVPADCVASETQKDTAYTLRQLTRVMKADTRRAALSCRIRPAA